MNEVTAGLIGASVGAILTFILAGAKDFLAEMKQPYVDFGNIGFNHPQGFSEESLTGSLAIYLYNSSQLPKVFMLESIEIDASATRFSFELKNSSKNEINNIIQLNPHIAQKLYYKVVFNPSSDTSIPDINMKTGIITYRTGKSRKRKTVKLYYYSPI